MVNVALVVKLQAKPGKEADVASFLEGGLPIVNDEPETLVWFALKLGPSTFGIFDAFGAESGRTAHLNGRVAAALMAKAPELLAEPPSIEKVDVLASKLAGKKVSPSQAKVAILARLEAKPGKEAEVESFLRGGLPIVEGEPETSTWFALKLGPSTFGIFDTFADESGRKAHLAGKVAAALMAKAPELLAKPPSLEMVEVPAAKLPR